VQNAFRGLGDVFMQRYQIARNGFKAGVRLYTPFNQQYLQILSVVTKNHTINRDAKLEKTV
jgi:hypothetical protein